MRGFDESLTSKVKTLFDDDNVIGWWEEWIGKGEYVNHAHLITDMVYELKHHALPSPAECMDSFSRSIVQYAIASRIDWHDVAKHIVGSIILRKARLSCDSIR